MLAANRMAPPRYPARAVATVIPAAAHTAEDSAACRLTPLARTGRPASSDPAEKQEELPDRPARVERVLALHHRDRRQHQYPV
jgi:hypothetical protein